MSVTELIKSTMNHLQNQHILILGLGASGLAMARWCVRCGAQVTVADTRSAPPQLATLERELPTVCFVGGDFDANLVQGVSAVFRSPGLRPADITTVSVAAKASCICVAGELALFSEALLQLKASRGYVPKVLAVTGTNGKTTVTTLTGKLVAQAGKSVAVAGNIGPTMLDVLSQQLDANDLPKVWVLELSSFQLEDATGFEPSAATILNVTQDHLDWHDSMAAYCQAKSHVFGKKGLMVLNREDPLVMAMLPAPVRVKLQQPQQRDFITFGSDMPQRPGDFGLEKSGGITWLVRAHPSEITPKPRKGELPELHINRLMPTDDLRISCHHNVINALAALALATSAGCALGQMLHGLRLYRGEPHRVQPVGVICGIEFFDDSKGTNVGATVAALTGLGVDRKVVVILGGEGKGQDFSPLAEPIKRLARAVVLMGRDAHLIRSALADVQVPLLHADSMEEAVLQANARAQTGDAVLMSPACASFDMFDNYEHRARVFVQCVQSLAALAGTSLEGGL